MIRWYRSIILVAAFLVFLSGSPACHAPVSIQTQAGKIAYTADQIAVRVTELENAAITANSTGALPTATTRTIVQFTVSAEKILQTTPAGWPAAVGQAWKETKAKLPPIQNPAVAAAVSAVDVVLAALGS